MVRFTPLSAAIGAEVSDIDLGKPLSAADIQSLRQAFQTRHLLLFRGQGGLSDDQHVALAGLFGTVADEYQDGVKIGWVTNRQNSKTTVPGEDKLHWHSDYSFTRWPLDAISLQAIELSGKGSNTRFASTARAWSALSEPVKNDLAQRKALHLANFSGEMADLDLQSAEYDDEPDAEAYPHTWHPMKLSHPVTGQPLLFINEFLTVRAEGLSTKDSRALFAPLWETLYDPDFVYEHNWREGDLLIWDKLALQHGRDAFTPEPGATPPVRTLRRVSLSPDYERMLESVPRLKFAVMAERDAPPIMGA